MKTYHLAAVGALMAAVAAAAGMTALAVYQYATHPQLQVGALAMEHAGHVLVVAVPTWLALALGFRGLLLRPLRKLESELYRVGTGNSKPVSVGSRVTELVAVEHAANLMVQRIELNAKAAGAHQLDDDLVALRDVATELAPVAPDAAERILERVTHLRRSMTALAQRRAASAVAAIGG